MEKMKSIINTYNSFKEQKDNLLLMNTKYESEIKKLKYELEQNTNLLEKTKNLLKNSEINNEKLNSEISYYSLNINKYKEDAAKALEDAVYVASHIVKREKNLRDVFLRYRDMFYQGSFAIQNPIRLEGNQAKLSTLAVN